jgi:hypothetical protein
MNEKQLEQHVTILGVLHLVTGVLFALIGLGLFALFIGIGLTVSGQDPLALRVLTIVAFVITGLMLLLALPGIITGYGLLKHRPWGRILAMVVGALNFFNVPIGTLIGIYTFWVLTQGSAEEYFVSLKPA